MWKDESMGNQPRDPCSKVWCVLPWFSSSVAPIRDGFIPQRALQCQKTLLVIRNDRKWRHFCPSVSPRGCWGLYRVNNAQGRLLNTELSAPVSTVLGVRSRAYIQVHCQGSKMAQGFTVTNSLLFSLILYFTKVNVSHGKHYSASIALFTTGISCLFLGVLFCCWTFFLFLYC